MTYRKNPWILLDSVAPQGATLSNYLAYFAEWRKQCDTIFVIFVVRFGSVTFEQKLEYPCFVILRTKHVYRNHDIIEINTSRERGQQILCFWKVSQKKVWTSYQHQLPMHIQQFCHDGLALTNYLIVIVAILKRKVHLHRTQLTIPLKEAAGLLQNFYHDPLWP